MSPGETTTEPSRSAPASPGWGASLNLEVERRGDRSVLTRRAHRGPFLVQRPFYPEGTLCPHICILHPPGGMVGGDQLNLRVVVGPSSAALLTTPAAAKFYRSAGARARVSQRIVCAGELEWLPQETIVFADARALLETRVNVSGTGRYLGREIICLGRPAASERFERGQFEQKLTIQRAGRASLHERVALNGGDELLGAAYGWQGRAVYGSLYCVAPKLAQSVSTVRTMLEKLNPPGGLIIGVTSPDPDLLVARCLGEHVADVAVVLEAVRAVLRPIVFSRPALRPRIWNT